MSIPGPVSPDVLSVRGLSKAFGAVQALRDVSVDCRAGEIHALVGENGSGKSTLLGIASGFLAPDEGTVEIAGARLTRHSPAAARLTVLREGVSQGTFPATSVSEGGLVELMIGRPLEVAFPERHAREADAEVLLEVAGLRGERFGPIDLAVKRGEIVGIAGAEGNGQVQFLRALAGVERASGAASCDGERLDMRSPVGPLRAGVVLLSGDRRGEALFPVLSVRANATVQVLRRLARLGVVGRRRERSAIRELIGRLCVRMGSAEQPISSLSGGNQQKVSLMRPFLRGDVKVILAEEPTQGVDVGARFDIYDALRAKVDEGIAAVVKSSDPIELAGLCDRVIVTSRGAVVEEVPGRHVR